MRQRADHLHRADRWSPRNSGTADGGSERNTDQATEDQPLDDPTPDTAGVDEPVRS